MCATWCLLYDQHKVRSCTDHSDWHLHSGKYMQETTIQTCILSHRHLYQEWQMVCPCANNCPLSVNHQLIPVCSYQTSACIDHFHPRAWTVSTRHHVSLHPSPLVLLAVCVSPSSSTGRSSPTPAYNTENSEEMTSFGSVLMCSVCLCPYWQVYVFSKPNLQCRNM